MGPAGGAGIVGAGAQPIGDPTAAVATAEAIVRAHQPGVGRRGASMDDNDEYGDARERHDLPLDPATMDVVCRRGGERAHALRFNIPPR